MGEVMGVVGAEGVALTGAALGPPVVYLDSSEGADTRPSDGALCGSRPSRSACARPHACRLLDLHHALRWVRRATTKAAQS